jgi:hypothetical protein
MLLKMVSVKTRKDHSRLYRWLKSLHHSRSPEVYDRNFGGLFAVWDRLFGTHADSAVSSKFDLGFAKRTAQYGLPGTIGEQRVVNNPVLSHLFPFWLLLQSVKSQGLSVIRRQPRSVA